MWRRGFLAGSAALLASPALASGWDIPRIFVGWGLRAEDPEAIARRLLAALRSLPDLSGTGASWTAVDPASAEGDASPDTWRSVPCDDVAALSQAMSWGTYPLRRGPADPPEFYKQFFYLGTFRDFHAKITCCAGVASAKYGMTLPNAFDLVLARDAPADDLRGALLGLVRAFDPVCGLVAAESVPARPVDWDGTPAVGAVTWLSRWFGRPPVLAPPLRVEKAAGGTLIEAFEGRYDPLDADRRAVLGALDSDLRAAGFLRAYTPG